MRLSIEVARLENSSNVLKIAYLYCLKQPFIVWFHFPSEHFCSGWLFVFPSAFRAPRRVASSPRGQIPVSCLNFNVQSVMEDEGERATAALPTQTPRRAGPRAAHPAVRAGPPAPPAALSAHAAIPAHPAALYALYAPPAAHPPARAAHPALRAAPAALSAPPAPPRAESPAARAELTAPLPRGADCALRATRGHIPLYARGHQRRSPHPAPPRAERPAVRAARAAPSASPVALSALPAPSAEPPAVRAAHPGLSFEFIGPPDHSH